jgi:hypothetical protein
VWGIALALVRAQWRDRVSGLPRPELCLQAHAQHGGDQARKLRRRLGGFPGLLSPIPPRPRHWRRDYYARAIAELVAVEATLAARLRDMVGRRRKRA